MNHIKMPVRYCYVDWMLFDADDQWIASFDAGDVGPKIACILNSYPDLLAACKAALEMAEHLESTFGAIHGDLGLVIETLQEAIAKAKGE